LAELAEKRPRSLAELAEISGLGEARIRKYGRRILAALRDE
jgi:superfamily II DNA helicase RecQ